ncbi:hypothetical protein Sarmat_00127 [Rickettsiales endosymbiont of Paramecium tredecaurelia]|uniref:SPOR domain-containing protein n=1 Tax=Candidatus Sarmatiella mevalonica TaxID=2770581 RepID=UPI001FC8B2A4|nr:SPOR domain-containing protein [Candidatus Sarmatiella mevalonica]MBL3284287.1 hypothetical protein [Candidatus Sarmatiella mevalonica]
MLNQKITQYKKHTLLLVIVIISVFWVHNNSITPHLQPQYVEFKSKPTKQQQESPEAHQSFAPHESILYSQLAKNRKLNIIWTNNKKSSKISDNFNQDSFGQLSERNDILESFQQNAKEDDEALGLDRIIKKNLNEDKIFITHLDLGLYYINIGYVVSIENGRALFERMSKLYELKDDLFKIHKVLKKHRIFYAILVGPYRELKDANDLCARITADGNSCFVVEDAVLRNQMLGVEEGGGK